MNFFMAPKFIISEPRPRVCVGGGGGGGANGNKKSVIQVGNALLVA